MKIIGKGQSGKFLIEATDREIANLFGFYWEGQLREAGIKLEPGMEIDPSKEYDKLAWLRKRNQDFNDLVKHLRRTADLIDNNRGAFDKIIQDQEPDHD